MEGKIMHGFLMNVSYVGQERKEIKTLDDFHSIVENSRKNEWLTDLRPINKFQYFDEDLRESNVFCLFDNDSYIEDIFVKYVNKYSDKSFPDLLFKRNFGKNFKANLRAIQNFDSELLSLIRTCLVLNANKVSNINAINDMLNYFEDNNINDIFTIKPERFTYLEWERHLYHTYGMGLNDYYNNEDQSYFKMIEPILRSEIEKIKTKKLENNPFLRMKNITELKMEYFE